MSLWGLQVEGTGESEDDAMENVLMEADQLRPLTIS